MSADTDFAMRASAKLLLVLASAAASLASCLLDREGLRSSGSGMAMGGGGAVGTSTATGTATGSATATSSSASGSGGTGGAESTCGDQVVEGVEQCDDGNQAGGDGCSSACTIEPLEACPGLPIPLTPAGIVVAGTLVGRSNDLLPSCAPSLLDVVYEVTPTVTGTLVATLKGNYPKSLSLRSICADGPTSELACAPGAGELVVTRWVYAGVKYHVVVDAGPEQFSLELALSACGDGAVQGLEACDNPADATCVGCFKCTGAGEVFDGASRHCYRLFTGDTKDWNGARTDCLGWGGDLVGVSSGAESDFLKAHFNDVWTGATDLVGECQFRWSNGEPWQPRWENNEPNNGGNNQDCGLFFNSGNMDDRSCDEHHDAVCERAPGGDCGDKIVQPGEECDDANTLADFTCAGCVVQCPAGQIKDPVTHHCYEIVTAMSVGWDAAQAACVAKGGYLAAINSVAENGLLQPSASVPLWIGGKRANPFRWLNTDPSCSFLNWASGEPNQTGNHDCATMQVNGSWITDICNQNHGYVCEHDN